MNYWDESPRRSLGIRDKKILYRNAKCRCQNPACRKKIEFDEMEVGHKRAASRGGKVTLKNIVCLCHRCNNLQGTDSWATFLKKQGIKDEKTKKKEKLKRWSKNKLNLIAKKYNIKIRGSYDDWNETYRPPSKTKLVNALSKRLSEEEIKSGLKKIPKMKKKKRKKRRESEGFFEIGGAWE